MRTDPQRQSKKSDVRPINYDAEARAQECKQSSTVTGAGETSVTYDECDEQREVTFENSQTLDAHVKDIH